MPSNRQPVTGTLADLLEREGNDLTAEESALMSRISAADPSEGAWLKEAIGDRFGLAPADLLGPDFERYVQVRFPVDKAWINEKDGWTWGGEVPPWEDPFPELYDEAPSLDPADWEQVYERVGGLNPSQHSALLEHLARREGEIIAGFWHGYSGFTSGDDDDTFIERIGNRFRSAVSRLVAPDAPADDDDDDDLPDSQAIAEFERQANLRLLPKELRDGPTLELPHREYFLLRFRSLADLANYLEWLEPYSWHPNLVWPVDRRWAYAVEVDGGSLLLGCDAQLAETLIADQRSRLVVQRRAAQVDVVVRRQAGGERHLAVDDGEVFNELGKASFGSVVRGHGPSLVRCGPRRSDRSRDPRDRCHQGPA